MNGYFGQLYVGVVFLGTVLFAIITGSIIVNKSVALPNLIGDAHQLALVVFCVSCVLAFLSALPKVRLLRYGSLPLALLLAGASLLFLRLLVRAPVRTEHAVATHFIGEYPCTSRYECHGSVGEQAKWWIGFVQRHPSTPAAASVAARLATNLSFIESEAERLEIARLLSASASQCVGETCR